MSNIIDELTETIRAFGISNDKKEFELEITAKAPEKIKKDLAKYLASDDIGLLEFAEVKIALEDLFKQMIH
jgi:hypothetical protein